MLKTEKTKPEVLEAHYGFSAPEDVLRVLHRDALLAKEKSIGEDVYEKPMAEVIFLFLLDMTNLSVFLTMSTVVCW